LDKTFRKTDEILLRGLNLPRMILTRDFKRGPIPVEQVLRHHFRSGVHHWQPHYAPGRDLRDLVKEFPQILPFEYRLPFDHIHLLPYNFASNYQKMLLWSSHLPLSLDTKGKIFRGTISPRLSKSTWWKQDNKEMELSVWMQN